MGCNRRSSFSSWVPRMDEMLNDILGLVWDSGSTMEYRSVDCGGEYTVLGVV